MLILTNLRFSLEKLVLPMFVSRYFVSSVQGGFLADKYRFRVDRRKLMGFETDLCGHSLIGYFCRNVLWDCLGWYRFFHWLLQSAGNWIKIRPQIKSHGGVRLKTDPVWYGQMDDCSSVYTNQSECIFPRYIFKITGKGIEVSAPQIKA